MCQSLNILLFSDLSLRLLFARVNITPKYEIHICDLTVHSQILKFSFAILFRHEI